MLYILDIINTFMLFWAILGQRKTSLVVFLWKIRTSSVVFSATILFLMAWYRPLEIILAKKTTKLVFLWPNMDQKSMKVLTCIIYTLDNTPLYISIVNIIMINKIFCDILERVFFISKFNFLKYIGSIFSQESEVSCDLLYIDIL